MGVSTWSRQSRNQLHNQKWEKIKKKDENKKKKEEEEEKEEREG
jgi:hypothetical protein